jgi:hypothetical protein
MENYYRTEIEYSGIVAMNKGMDQYLTVMFVTHPKSKVSQYIYWTLRERIQNLLTDKFDKFYKLLKSIRSLGTFYSGHESQIAIGYCNIVEQAL